MKIMKRKIIVALLRSFNLTLIGFIKNYVYLKVKLVFDPPTSSFVVESIKQSISEYEWRINAAVDY